MSKIVIVEDDDTTRMILHRTLTEAGHRCFLAVNVAGGLELCARERPDLVLLDGHLPDGNGIDACRRIKADAALSGVSVMIVTGMHTEAEQLIQGLEAGADDYVVKPFRMEELSARVREVLRRRSKSSPAS